MSEIKIFFCGIAIKPLSVSLCLYAENNDANIRIVCGDYKRNAENKMYIHQLKAWPNFTWDDKSFSTLLNNTRFKQGKLLGKMKGNFS